VETFIASGNVIFEAAGKEAALEEKVERHLAQSLGYAVATFLRTPAERAAVVAHESFADADEAYAIYIGFLKAKPPAERVKAVKGLSSKVNELVVHGRELYWLSRMRTGDNPITGARLEKALGGQVTLRNLTTVRKLAEKYGSSS
jgi:uncharacterized protein (DUF1697 family)